MATNALIQKKDTYFANGTGAAAESLAFASSVSSTDLLFCAWRAGKNSGNGALISSLTDSLGNTYSALPPVQSSPLPRCRDFMPPSALPAAPIR